MSLKYEVPSESCTQATLHFDATKNPEHMEQPKESTLCLRDSGHSEIPQKPPNCSSDCSQPAGSAKAPTAELSPGHTRGPLWWDSKLQLLGQHSCCSIRGAVLHVEHTHNYPLLLLICSYPPGYFCFHSVPLDFLPHLRNGTINDCKYNLTLLW